MLVFFLHVQVLFACAEALYAHGYSNEACRLAVELARDLLANPPDLKVEQPQTKVNKVTCDVQSETKPFKLSTTAAVNYVLFFFHNTVLFLVTIV